MEKEEENEEEKQAKTYDLISNKNNKFILKMFCDDENLVLKFYSTEILIKKTFEKYFKFEEVKLEKYFQIFEPGDELIEGICEILNKNDFILEEETNQLNLKLIYSKVKNPINFEIPEKEKNIQEKFDDINLELNLLKIDEKCGNQKINKLENDIIELKLNFEYDIKKYQEKIKLELNEQNSILLNEIKKILKEEKEKNEKKYEILTMKDVINIVLQNDLTYPGLHQGSCERTKISLPLLQESSQLILIWKQFCFYIEKKLTEGISVNVKNFGTFFFTNINNIKTKTNLLFTETFTDNSKLNIKKLTFQLS
jgi:hypothetical protein